jgi:hypothetical protein
MHRGEAGQSAAWLYLVPTSLSRGVNTKPVRALDVVYEGPRTKEPHENTDRQCYFRPLARTRAHTQKHTLCNVDSQSIAR